MILRIAEVTVVNELPRYIIDTGNFQLSESLTHTGLDKAILFFR